MSYMPAFLNNSDKSCDVLALDNSLIQGSTLHPLCNVTFFINSHISGWIVLGEQKFSAFCISTLNIAFNKMIC